MMQYIECIFQCNNHIDKCNDGFYHICKWCRTSITKEDIYRMYRYSEPHCQFQQDRKERDFKIAL